MITDGLHSIFICSSVEQIECITYTSIPVRLENSLPTSKEYQRICVTYDA